MTSFRGALLSFLLAASTPALVQSNLRGSGVTRILEGKYDETLGSCTGATCTMWGDPHLITCDGLAYDCMPSGIYTLMKNHMYNIQGHFIPVGEEEMELVKTWSNFHHASMTNDIAIEYSPDDKDDDVPYMQFSFPDLTDYEKHTHPSEEGCAAYKAYKPINMPGQGRSVEPDIHSCRARCEATPKCKAFSWWADGGCHINLGTEKVVSTPKSWSRSLSGSLESGCGTPPAPPATPAGTEMGKSLLYHKNCPLLFYLDGVQVDISGAKTGDYIYGDETTDHSAELMTGDTIRITHKTAAGAVSEVHLKQVGHGPGEIWGCHWNMYVCLPHEEEALFRDYSVGLLGSPDGNTQNDWMDVNGNVLPIYGKKNQGAYDYCKNNWCVSQADSIFVYPEGMTYENFKCVDEEYVEFDYESPSCLLSAEKIREACDDEPPMLHHSCLVDCCNGGCDEYMDTKTEIEDIKTLSNNDEDIVYEVKPPSPMCEGDVYKYTSDGVCPDSDEGVVSIVYKSSPIVAEDENIVYGIKISPQSDDDRGLTVKVNIDNPFPDYSDVFVSYSKKVGVYALDKACASQPMTPPGCYAEAKTIELGCHDLPDMAGTASAMFDVYFALPEAAGLLDLADEGLDQCCLKDYAPTTSKGVVKYTFKVDCGCPEVTSA